MQKRKRTRRVAAVLIAVAMILTTLTTSGTAFAAEESPYRLQGDNSCEELSGQACDSHNSEDSSYQSYDDLNIAEEITGQPYAGGYYTEEAPTQPYEADELSYTQYTDEWQLQVTGNMYSLRLLSIDYGLATALILQSAVCNGFYAISDNFTNWEIIGPATEQDEYTNVPPHMDLSKAGILRIERLPYHVDNNIKWIGFAILENTVGDIWREQIRIFVDGVWLNPLPLEPGPPVITGLNGFSWAREAVEFVVARDLMNMYLCNETNEYIGFNPTGSATRGDVLAAAVKALGLTAPDFEETSHVQFYDVPLTGRGIYIDIAKQLGLVVGVGHNNFAPDSTITRQDMMTMLYNIMMAMGQIQPDTGLTALGRFSDLNQISSYARLPISSLARAGIIAGDGVSINPRGDINRVEAAMFVRNLYRVGEAHI